MTTRNYHSKNPMLRTDFYKTIHHLAYVSGLDYLVSYWTPRMSRHEGINKVVMFGLQGLIIHNLIDMFEEWFFKRPWEDVKDEYIRVIKNTMTEQAANVDAMKSLYDLGYLPIQIKAVAEGERVNIKTPMFEIRNTVKGFGWLVNYLETYISVNIWHPMTSASVAYEYRELVNVYFEKTVESGSKSAACGDFSMRGMTSEDSAERSSAAHLLSFTGTATISAIMWLEDYYNCDCTKEVVGKGVPSTEHSVMSSYGREGEFECYRHLIEDVFKTGPLSIVSDTYDYWNVITNYLPRLKKSIMARDGKIIIRGDSGDPVDIICGKKVVPISALGETHRLGNNYLAYSVEDSDGIFASGVCDFSEKMQKYIVIEVTEMDSIANYCHYKPGYYVAEPVTYSSCEYTFDGEIEFYTLEKIDITEAELKGTVELLWDIFGGHINSKGYKVLDSHIGAIYGDGITIERAIAIYERLTDKGFAVNNCTLGIGSYTYQYRTRDSLGFALKATDSIIDGVETPIYKDPITDRNAGGGNFKKSQRGLCYVYREGEDILYTDGHTFEELKEDRYKNNLLEVVFKDSKLVKEYSLAEIRCRLHKGAF